MPKYIDQSVAIARLTHLEVTKPTATMTDAKRALADMFPADVAPVVRCRDCRKFNSGAKKCLNPNSFIAVPADDDYCSYGEKRA